MGKVFTATQVQQGLVPRLEDFVSVRKKVTNALRLEPTVDSALIFGSVVRGDHTVRSDLDCAVVYQWGQHRAASDFLGRLIVEASRVHVPLNIELCDSGTAASRFHRFGPSFRIHLQNAQEAGGSIKGDVCRHFAPSVSDKEEHRSYLAQKLSKLEKGRIEYPTRDVHGRARYLQKVLEAPLHVARKMLAYGGQLEGDSKADVFRTYKARMDRSLASTLRSLIALDEAYSELLERAIKNKDMLYYKEGLKRTFECTDTVITFVRENIGVLERAD